MNEFQKMLSGRDFDNFSDELMTLRKGAFQLLKQINNSHFSDAIPSFKKLFHHVGDKTIICPPFTCEYGKSISVGHSCYLNMGITMLDNAAITIGDHVLIGPNAQFYTASHPTHFSERRKHTIFRAPITIEDDVWIGGNVIINQGITIGARSIIAAGAVVTKNVPADSLYGGIPAKFIKQLNLSAT